MARNQVRNGSQGNDVKELQKILNQNGYNLTEDGIFGTKTDSAVRDYQKKNGLSVDGIVGTNTWGALSGGARKAPSTNATTSTNNSFSYKDFAYDDYLESDTVNQALSALNTHLANKPSEYQSQWQTQLDDTIKKILNREDFSYDLNGDALYQQYKDKYIKQGKLAMSDAIGQASALTGGYGNSYAQSVGQQQYQAQLENLNDIVPELYQMALDKYNREGEDLYNQYAMLGDQENLDYGRYRDAVADYLTERDYLAGRYDSERDYDYSKYVDGRDFNYGIYSDDKSYAYQGHRDDIADDQWKKSYEYQIERDKIADEQWQTEFDEAKRQFNAQHLEDMRQFNYNYKAKQSSGNDNTGYVPPKDDVEPEDAGFKAVESRNVDLFKSALRTKNEFYGRSSPEKEKYKTYEAYIEGKLDEWLGSGKLNDDEAATLIAYYGLA